MRPSLKLTVGCMALAAGGIAMAESTGGFSTADGNVSTARKFTASTFEVIRAILDAGVSGAYPLHITYTGNEDALIGQIVKDHTADAPGNCPRPHCADPYRRIEIRNSTAGVTLEGADGSSANWGIVINNGSSNVVVRNMKIGALGGARNDADMIRIDGASNLWIDHNE